MGWPLVVRVIRIGVALLLISVVRASGGTEEPQPGAEKVPQPKAADPEDGYERLFPHYRKLHAPVDLSTPFFSPQGLADLIEERTGLSVELDREELERIELSSDEDHGDGFLLGRGNAPLDTYVQEVLRKVGLTIVLQPDRLVITSPERAEVQVHLYIEFYPVADLFLSNHPTPPELLADPVFDAESTAAARIRANLKRPVTLDAVEKPLAALLFDIATQLDVPLIVDDRHLNEVGLDTEMPVTFQCRHLPGEEAFDRILRPLRLEAHRLSTVVVVAGWVHPVDRASGVRLHSVQGLVYECRQSQAACRPGRSPLEFGPATSSEFFDVETADEPGETARGTAADATEHHLGKDTSPVLAAPGREVPEAFRPARDEATPTNANTRAPLQDQERDLLAEEPRYRADFDSLVRAITRMVAPQTWDEVGGPGKLFVSSCTLDLLVHQTPYVHEEIEEFLDRLRRLPPVVGGHSAMRPARVPQFEHLTGRELEGLRKMLTHCIAFQTWEAVGGPGAMTYDIPRGVLVVSQTRDVHQQLRHFLTQLRRRRQEQLQQENRAPDTRPESVDCTTKYTKDE